MTTIDDLIALVEAQPECDTFRDMLVDELIELRDIDPHEARIHVGRVAQAALTARQIREATALLTPGTESSRWVHSYIAFLTGASRRTGYTVLITDGTGIKTSGVPSDGPIGRIVGSAVIRVGASWLLGEWARHLAGTHPNEADLRRRRRR